MTYKETLDWMFVQLPMFQQKGKVAFNAKLDKMLLFTGHLNHPERKIKTIHVAGTNGKGSSCHMLASILQESGYKVGLYTSPHLKDFKERIRINGKPVSENFVVDFIEENRLFFEENKLSFFEMTVGMSFDYFSKERVDIAIIEVGLGGRFDSTNIINPEVSLITNIGLDHTDMLGDTLSKIAFEKAGIIKPNTPVVISETQQETKTVFKNKAKAQNARLIFADITDQKEYNTDLLGDYQVKNSKGVLAVIDEIKGFVVTEGDIQKGFLNVVKNTGLKGRWQVLAEKPKTVCDTAHNVEGLSLVLKQIKQQTYNSLHIVLGFVKDKDLDTLLALFPKNASYYFCKPNISRGLGVELLASKAKIYGLQGKVYDSVTTALQEASTVAKAEDFVFVGGSNFVVAEVI